MRATSSNANCAISVDERRGPVTMGLLWITMVTIFPGVLVGFEWFKDGIAFSQVLVCAVLSCILLLAYTIPTAHLSALTGHGYDGLNRRIFGESTAAVINFNLVWMFIAWYGLTAVLMAEGISGLFGLKINLALLSGAMAIAMAFNNFFGFKGVANFARYIAAPVLIFWVGYTFCKAAPSLDSGALLASPERSLTYAMTTISSFMIGVYIWGNEADYWRYGRPKLKYSSLPLAVAFFIGMVVFPVTGWIVARMTGIGDYAQATKFMNQFSFAGLPAVGALVLFASYFASNDSNLFGSTAALESLRPMRHRSAVTILAILGALTAVSLSFFGGAKGIETIASINCVIMPMPSIIVLCEWFLAAKVFRTHAGFLYSTRYKDIYEVQRAPSIALAVGIGAGILMSGVIPGTEILHVGVCPLQAWFAALLVYVPLRMRENHIRQSLLLQSERPMSTQMKTAPVAVSIK